MRDINYIYSVNLQFSLYVRRIVSNSISILSYPKSNGKNASVYVTANFFFQFSKLCRHNYGHILLSLLYGQWKFMSIWNWSMSNWDMKECIVYSILHFPYIKH